MTATDVERVKACVEGLRRAGSSTRWLGDTILANLMRDAADLLEALLAERDRLTGEAGRHQAQLDRMNDSWNDDRITLDAVKAALDQLEADYAARKHGGVAQDQCVQAIKRAVRR